MTALDPDETTATPTPTLSHRPFGSGHPYRYDLDQRVPVHPVVEAPTEIRVLADPSIAAVAVEIGVTGTSGTAEIRRVSARHVAASELEQDLGPFPARRTEEGHLAAAAEASHLGEGAVVWVAEVEFDGPATYHVVGQTADGQVVDGGAHRVAPVRWEGGASAPAAGRLLVEGDAGHRLDADSVEWLVGADGAVRVRFAVVLDAEQHVIGLGERYATLDHRGEQLDAVVFEQYKHQGRRTYLPVPMAVVVGGDHWGFHVDTSRRTWFDLAATVPDRIVIEAEVDPSLPELTIHLWSGEPARIVDQFLEATGRPQLPPSWVYEPWMSANEWNTQERVEREVARSLDEDVPVGVIVIEAWSDESTFLAFSDARYPVHADGEPHRLADFTFPEDGAWPDPVGMVRRLHEAGIRVLLWQIPLVPTDRGEEGQIASDVDAIVRLGHCVREADGSPYHNRGWWFPGALLPDFTDPAVRRWWAERRRYLVEEVGIDGFKTDGGEHLWGHDLRYADGTRGDESNNRFPVLFAQTYHELFESCGVAGTTFSRAGFTGSARFPCHWAGDDDSTWDGMVAAIHAGLSAGVAGVWFWTWDLAGFSGPIPDAELYVRSAAMSTFCPLMQYHAEYNHHQVPSNDRTPWNIAERTGDERVLQVFRRFAHLRRRLVPYLAEQAARSLITSKPLMRPLCFDHPDDPAVWSWPLQFQLGDDLLVAPVTSPAESDEDPEIEVYLPAGTWTDAFRGSVHEGPVTLRRTVPWDEAAVYVRAGASPLLADVFTL
jgi:alpha-glucosidase (family GH31 glycosyl hydrolase)